MIEIAKHTLTRPPHTHLVEDHHRVALALGHVVEQQPLDRLHVARHVSRHVRVPEILPPQNQQPPRAGAGAWVFVGCGWIAVMGGSMHMDNR